MGRARKPTILHEIQGTSRPDRQRPNEPRPAIAVPPCPIWLDTEARAEWKRITAELLANGLIARLDRALLVTYCQAWSDLRAAAEDIKARGRVVEGVKGQRLNPYVTIRSQAAQIMLSIAPHFGLSPSTRAKISAPLKEEATDPFEEFLNRGKKAH